MRRIPRHRPVSPFRLRRHRIRTDAGRRVRVLRLFGAVARVVGVVDDARQVRSKADLSAGGQLRAALRRRYRVAARSLAALALRLLTRLEHNRGRRRTPPPRSGTAP